MRRETVQTRVALTKATHEQLRQFCRGLDATYDEAIQFLFHVGVGDIRDSYIEAGLRRRPAFEEFKRTMGWTDDKDDPG